METDGSEPDVRGRSVVWSAGVPTAPAPGGRIRGLIGRAGFALAGAGIIAALLGVIATWSIVAPVDATTTTPLWITPPQAAGPHPAPTSRSAEPRHTPSPSAVASRAIPSVRGDDRSGKSEDSSKSDDRSGKDEDSSKSDKSGKSEDSSKSGESDKDEDSSKSDDRSGKSDDSRKSGKSDKSDDKSGKSDDKSGKSDDKSGKDDDKSGKSDDKSGKSDDKSGKDDDKSGKSDDKSGKDDDD